MKLRALLLRAAHHNVAQVLGSSVALAGAGIGGSLLLTPEVFTGYWAFAENFHWVSAPAWGALFLCASILLAITVWVETEHAQTPALVVGTLFLFFGALTLLSGVSAFIWVFVALGWISIFTQIVCWAKEKQRETVLHGYEP